MGGGVWCLHHADCWMAQCNHSEGWIGISASPYKASYILAQWSLCLADLLPDTASKGISHPPGHSESTDFGATGHSLGHLIFITRIESRNSTETPEVKHCHPHRGTRRKMPRSFLIKKRAEKKEKKKSVEDEPQLRKTEPAQTVEERKPSLDFPLLQQRSPPPGYGLGLLPPSPTPGLGPILPGTPTARPPLVSPYLHGLSPPPAPLAASEPFLSAVTPFTPLIQPLALRLCNGKPKFCISTCSSQSTHSLLIKIQIIFYSGKILQWLLLIGNCIYIAIILESMQRSHINLRRSSWSF